MAKFAELTKAFKKDYGDTVGGQGFMYAEMKRAPFGYFPLDLALGGGYPRGKFIELYGKEGSCKTNLALKAVATHQKLYPKKKCVWFDIEDTFDPRWAKKFGVDVDGLYVFKPDYGEAMIDITEGLLASDECGLLVIDSLAALVTTRELGQSAEKSDVGGAGLLMSKLVRKVIATLSRARKEGNEPTVICINQTRMKIGVMFGDPETTPGGQGKNFAASLRIRVYGKDVKDAKFHPHLPVRKELKIVFKKWKFPIVMDSVDMEMAMLPHKNMRAGDVDEWKMFFSYMFTHEVLVKKKSEKKNAKGKKEKYILMGEHEFDTQQDVKAFLIKKTKLKLRIMKAIIKVEKAKAVAEQDAKDKAADQEDAE